MNTTDTVIPVSTRDMLTRDRAFADAGLSLRNCEVGTATVTMTVSERMLNGYGRCHGGWLLFLADATFGCAANSHGLVAVSAYAQMNFISGATLGETLSAQACLKHRHGRNGIYDVSIRGGDNRLVAEFRATARFKTATDLSEKE
ncbi:hotdog fold thioesterase [Rhodococcus sp. ABRD24]|uniref:hotdog fold thioesterase n=1 Tax=Rhodococcus sp. ABRD24 TaxID=2507582 RepID=UPI001040583A|nr:hotdog fold thioesterase [Rhodococcus sp. ABRD24]QBJ97324.1 hotdog fold thioesterase [Rhodococcus sp. ABRD24]